MTSGDLFTQCVKRSPDVIFPYYREVAPMSALRSLRQIGLVWRGATLLVLLAASSSVAIQGQSAPAPSSEITERIAFNDNRTAAGTTSGQTVSVQLEARLGRWHPDGDNEPFTVVKAFAVQGGPLQLPGPMIRVRE